MKRISAYILSLVIGCSLCFSCSKESTKSTYSKQETNIENFLSSQTTAHEEYSVVSNSGSYRLIVVPGSGEALEKNGTISFYYAGYTLTGTSISNSNLFATNSRDVATQAGWSSMDEGNFLIKTMNLGEVDLVEGLKNGLIGVQGGEECFILFSGKHGFGSKQLGTINANSALVYHIWVESISND